MIVEIKNDVRSDFAGYNEIARLAAMTKDERLETITFDFKRCSFFEANLASVLFVVVSKLRDGLNSVDLLNLNSSVTKILRKNHFLTQFHQPVLFDTNATTVPFKIFKLHAGDQFNDYLGNYMHGKGIPVMSTALTKRFRQSLFEIFQNAAIHSTSESGVYSCGQYYPQKHRLDFTIADAGVGIRQNVRRFTGDHEMNSVDAIKWALTEGNSTKTSMQPGGLGLKLLKDFIGKNNGKLQIVSRLGFYEFSSIGETYSTLDYDYPGTCINIEINTNDTKSYRLKSEVNNDSIF